MTFGSACTWGLVIAGGGTMFLCGGYSNRVLKLNLSETFIPQ